MSYISDVKNFRKPLVTTTPIIKIKNGRHPLQELCVDNFIPNDTNLKKSNSLCKRIDDDIDIIESDVPSTRRMGTSNRTVSFDNSFNIDSTCFNTMIITGANASGKSVYMKQVALIIILAQIGW